MVRVNHGRLGMSYIEEKKKDIFKLERVVINYH